MKAAFVYCEDRIAPVFDVAQQVFLIDAISGTVLSKTMESLSDASLTQKVLRLYELNVEVLICGAISRPLCDMVSAYGIQIISFVAGKLDEIVDAWVEGRLDADTYAMPGCCRRRKSPHKCRNRSHSDIIGNQGIQTADAIEYCICLECGHRQPHQRSQPCREQCCPKCGFTMTSE